MNDDHIFGALDCLAHLINNVLHRTDAIDCFESYVTNYDIKVEDLKKFEGEYFYEILEIFIGKNGEWDFNVMYKELENEQT